MWGMAPAAAQRQGSGRDAPAVQALPELLKSQNLVPHPISFTADCPWALGWHSSLSPLLLLTFTLSTSKADALVGTGGDLTAHLLPSTLQPPSRRTSVFPPACLLRSFEPWPLGNGPLAEERQRSEGRPLRLRLPPVPGTEQAVGN